jgi:hypothetical protein
LWCLWRTQEYSGAAARMRMEAGGGAPPGLAALGDIQGPQRAGSCAPNTPPPHPIAPHCAPPHRPAAPHLGEAQLVALRHAYLLLDKVDAGDHLSHRVLNLRGGGG